MIGRDEQLEELIRLFDSARLITLTGFGGCGKTRLAIQLAHAMRGRFASGAWFVDLSSVSDSALVLPSIESVLGVQSHPGSPSVDALCEQLHDQQLLFVLDNCEHVVESVAAVVLPLMLDCHGVHILTTSREPLGVTGEVVWPVPLLDLPTSSSGVGIEQSGRSSAVRLFMERAQAVRPDFAATASNLEQIAEICRELDGLPLAIELAAARVKVLSLPDISTRLSNRFRLLTVGGRGAQPRQQTLLGAIQWSYDLLDYPERRLFERLSVFRGGWTLGDAEEICMPTESDDGDALELMTRLVDKSLVVTTLGEDGSTRYSMLESLREFALDRLTERGDLNAIRELHARSRLLQAELAEPKLSGPGYGVWLTRLESDYANFRAALQWAAETENASLLLRLSAALSQFWWLRGRSAEGRGWFDLSLQQTADLGDLDRYSQAARARVHMGLAVILRREGDHQAALGALGAADDIFLQLDDRLGHATALLQRGVTANVMGDYDEAQRCLLQSLTEHQRLGHSYGVTLSLLQLALIAFWQGDDRTAATRVNETLASFSDSTDRSRESALWLSGMIALGAGQIELARTRLDESLSLIVNAGDSAILHFVIDGLAAVDVAQRQPRRALMLGGAAEMLREKNGFQRPIGWITRIDPVWERARMALSAADAASSWAEGRALPLELLLETVSRRAEPEQTTALRNPDPLSGLTRRERDVLQYVVRGLTNRQIADDLSIGERTVETHVANLLGKIGVASRTQLLAKIAADGLIVELPS